MSISSPVQPSLLGRMNEQQLLSMLREHGPASRAELRDWSGISAPTISKTVASLMESGLLEEFVPESSVRGRPPSKLRLATENAQVFGVVIDADYCSIVRAGLDGALDDPPKWVRFGTPATYRKLINTLVSRIAKLADRKGVETLGIGVSMPGLIDDRKRVGLLSPNLPITDGRSPEADLQRRLGIETVMLQETHALCLAERHYGEAVGLDDFAMLDVSTGVGLGVMSGGKLIKGHRGLAGEIGHITIETNGRKCGCGNVGCLETVASDSALTHLVSRKSRRGLDLDQIIERHLAGKLDIAKEVAQVREYLAIGAGAVINLFNPSTLFVHGRIFELDEEPFETFVDEVRKRTLGPSFDDCDLILARGRKEQGAVAGIIQHLTDSYLPAGLLPA